MIRHKTDNRGDLLRKGALILLPILSRPIFIIFIIIIFCRSLCYCLVDLISHPNGRYPREDGAPGHTVPGAGQHLQQRHHQHPQGRGAHSDRSLDVGLYPLCFRSLSRVSLETKEFLKTNLVFQVCHFVV